jgi:hypothetical protein
LNAKIRFTIFALGQGPNSNPKGQQRPSEVTMMIDDKLARIRATVNNIRRYRRLLETQLTELERQFIQRRLAEERAALDAFNAETFPMAFRSETSRITSQEASMEGMQL